MGLDALSPVAPARIRCLALPCGNITRSRFLEFVNRLQQENVVRLGDVSPNTGPSRNMFTPLAFPTGLAIYDISTSIPSPSQLALAPFEIYREPLVIMGVADGLEYSSEGTHVNPRSRGTQDDTAKELNSAAKEVTFGELSRVLELLKEKYQSALLHEIFIFDCDRSGPSIPAGLVPVPSFKKSKTTTMKTIMCDLSSLLLGEMTGYAKSLLALPNIETPKSNQRERPFADRASSGFEGDGIPRPESRISGTTTSRSSSPAGDAERLRHRASVQGYPVAADEPEERSRSRAQSNGNKTPPISFDQMNGLPGLGISTSNKDKSRQPSKDRIPVQGFGSGSVGERARTKAKGRIGVVLGSLYLLAGRWPDAVKELVESATVARAISDHVWHAKALDYILVCLLMCAWAGMDFEVTSDVSASKCWFSKLGPWTDIVQDSTNMLSTRGKVEPRAV
ncbi:hypothetical protein MMC30_007127 [Trapelia coarctata]|nr:hypothetical protein [Trapelia coarctata]